MLHTRAIGVVFLVICLNTLALATLTDVYPAGDGQICMSTANISWDNVPNMVTSTFMPQAEYTFAFVNGSKNISDGSDFDAVRSAFDTWLGLPDSDIFASEVAYAGQLDPGSVNGRNEISWIGLDDSGTDLWGDILGFSSNTIATVVTWYYSGSGEVVERDMYFNDVNMDWRTDSDGIDGGFNVEHIALHEIGHIYGLEDVYNPGQAGYEEWMGSCNSSLTMYGYSNAGNNDITLSAEDIYAMSLAHPASVPEPGTGVLLLCALPVVVSASKRRCRKIV